MMPEIDVPDDILGRGGDVNLKIDFLRYAIPLYELEDFSGQQTLDDLRDIGFRINNSLFYLVRRQVIGSNQANVYDAISYFPDAYYPTEQDLGVSDRFMERRYKFIFLAEAEDLDSGETYYQTFGLQMDSFSNIEELKAQAEAYAKEHYEQLSEGLINISLSKGMRRA